MPGQQKSSFEQLEAGLEFPPISYDLDAEIISRYVRAVGETSSLYENNELVPPTAIVAFALLALTENISLLPGTIHISQEIQSLGIASVGDTVTYHAKVSRKQERGNMRLLDIGFDASNQTSVMLMQGKMSFILPESD